MFQEMMDAFLGNLDTGVLVTICGVAIVFLVLVILIFAITIFGKIMTSGSKVKATKPVAEKAVPAAKAAPVAAPAAAAAPSQDEGELIAVIAAAVDAIYAGSGKKAVIRNIRPATTGGRSAWAAAGLAQNVRSF